MSSHLLVCPDSLFRIDHVLPEEAAITEILSCVLHRGIRAQVVFDTTPISVAGDALRSAANNGRLILCSFFYPDIPISISLNWFHKSGSKLLETANSHTVDFTKAARLLSQGIIDVKPFVSEVYELKDYKQAFESAIKGDKFRVVIKS